MRINLRLAPPASSNSSFHARQFAKPPSKKTHCWPRVTTIGRDVKELAPDNARRDNFKPALVATQFACGNPSLFTVGANVGVQQDLAVLSKHCITMDA